MRNIFIFIFISSSIFAQTSYSIKDAISKGISNSESIEISKLNVNIQKDESSKSISKFLPTINGVIDWRYNIILPTNIIPGDIFGTPGIDKEARFGTNWNLTTGIELNMSIYDANNFGNAKNEKLEIQIKENNVTKTKQQLELTIAKAYYTCIILKNQIGFYDQSIKKSLTYYKDMQSLFSQGQIQEYDLILAKNNYEIQELEKSKAEKLLEQSYQYLAYYMGINENDKFILTDSIIYKENVISISKAQANVSNTIDYQNLLIQYNQSKVTKNKWLKTYIPTVGLYGYLGAQSLRNDISDLFTQKWFGTSYIGLKVNIPIFDGLLKQKNIHQSKLTLLKNELLKKDAEENFEFQQKYTLNGLEASIDEFIIAEKNWKLAELNKNNVEERLKNELANIRDVNDAENSLLKQYNLYLQAALNVYLKKVEYYYTIGINTY